MYGPCPLRTSTSPTFGQVWLYRRPRSLSRYSPLANWKKKGPARVGSKDREGDAPPRPLQRRTTNWRAAPRKEAVADRYQRVVDLNRCTPLPWPKQAEKTCCKLLNCRGVAQPGSAPALGAGGRVFESRRPDHKINNLQRRRPRRVAVCDTVCDTTPLQQGCIPRRTAPARSRRQQSPSALHSVIQSYGATTRLHGRSSCSSCPPVCTICSKNGLPPEESVTRLGLPRHYQLQMTEHIRQSEIDRLSANDLNTTEWARVRRHLFECDTCLSRLLDREGPLPTHFTFGQSGSVPVQSSAPIRAYVY